MDSFGSPDRSVGAHLQAALDDAIDDLDSGPIGGATDFWLRAARIAIELRRRLVVGPGDAFLDEQVAELLSEDPNANPLEFVEALNNDVNDESIPPFRYAIAIQLAFGLVELLPAMQQRLYGIDSKLSGFPVAPVARPYISVAMEAYLTTLDAAVPPLIRAGFEHAAQDWLTTVGGIQQSAIRSKSAGALLVLLKARGALTRNTAQAAESIVRRGNEVMHRGGAGRVTQEDAAAAIGELAQVLSELVPRNGSRGTP